MFADLFILGLCAHIVADWFLQTDWQAQNKIRLSHSAAWIHSGVHLACFLPVFGWKGALIVFVTHILIDTRKPLMWWRSIIGQKMNDPSQPFESAHNSIARHVAFWQDQMSHILVIAAVAWFLVK